MTNQTLKTEEEMTLKLFVVLSRATRAIQQRIEEDIKRHGLHPTDFGVLELLYHKGRQPIQRIGERILLTSGSMTYVVDKLEKRQLIKRQPCPDDRRVVHVVLTEEGEKLMADIFPHHSAAIQQILGGLTIDEKKKLTELLKKLGIYAQNYQQPE